MTVVKREGVGIADAARTPSKSHPQAAAAAVVTPPSRAQKIERNLKRKRNEIEVNPNFDIYAEIKAFTAARPPGTPSHILLVDTFFFFAHNHPPSSFSAPLLSC